ncbi:hypothetical protein DelCs14_3261 [Delftia sp. Cs1-4]|uniref:recombinase RecT n=1 Tax=Delftia sp. (strain Cs1-4) TaxID=742013 RepID=UPI00020E8319|nr:recombinase RecT [Delftia sp. Cs1-4]AEF90261.1 hypothetical protein DelCs14_3261 [Delftia sp. Cs1-4]
MNSLVTQASGGQLRAASQFDLSPQNFEQALTFSNYLAESDMVPKDFKGKPGNCLIAMQWGAELGLKPLQSLQNLAVINGRPALWGDAVIALVLASPVCEYVNEDDDGKTAYCRVKRKGGVEQVRSFSMDDAIKAGLAGKQGPWSQYPKRMRQMRARAFALRDVFPDVLRGMPVAEELQDMANAAPPQGERHMGDAEVVQPEWPADRWAAGLAKWVDGIVSGGKPIADVLVWLGSKGKVTAEQEKQLRDEVAKRQGASAAPAGAAAGPATDADGVLVVDAAKLEQDLRGAADLDTLYKHGSLLDAVEDLGERQRLTEIFEARVAELEG